MSLQIHEISCNVLTNCRTFKDSVPFKDIIKNEQLCQNLANMGYTRATASQAATIERYEKLGEVSNMKITAPFSEFSLISKRRC